MVGVRSSMPTVHNVPAELLIPKLADQLKKMSQIQAPPWTQFTKTGSHGPMSLGDLKSEYGGRVKVGYSPGHHRDAGGSIIRKTLQQLELSGLVNKEHGKGRILTSKGKSLLDRISGEIYKELVKSNPVLMKYS